MRQIAIIILLLTLSLMGRAQEGKTYIFLNEDSLSFNQKIEYLDFLTSKTELKSKKDKNLDIHIYNLYFNRANQCNPNDEIAVNNYFKIAFEDINTMPLDLLITITPLVDKKNVYDMVEINDDLQKYLNNSMSYKELIKMGLKSVYEQKYKTLALTATNKELAKTIEYSLIVKRKNKYFLYNNITVLEFFAVSSRQAYYPTEHSFVEILTRTNRNTMQSVRGDADDILLQSNKYLHTVNRILLQEYDRLNNSHIITNKYYINGDNGSYGKKFYANTEEELAKFPVGNGVGEFNFLPKIGIINGNYSMFFNRGYNYVASGKHDKYLKNITYFFDFEIERINNLSLDDFCTWYINKYEISGIIPIL